MIEGFAREMPEDLMARGDRRRPIGIIREICDLQDELVAQGRRGEDAVRAAAGRRPSSTSSSARYYDALHARPSRPRASRPGPRPCRR